MKLPSVFIAACLAAGIIGGPAIRAHLPTALPVCLGAALLALLPHLFAVAAEPPAEPKKVVAQAVGT